jgi:hypothetical protein
MVPQGEGRNVGRSIRRHTPTASFGIEIPTSDLCRPANFSPFSSIVLQPSVSHPAILLPSFKARPRGIKLFFRHPELFQ